MKDRKPELLMPAGSPVTAQTAIRYGADAIYMGGEAFSLRAKAKNFTREQMVSTIRTAHEAGVKVYVTANIFAHNEDLEDAREYFAFLKEAEPDAVLISDPGLFTIFREECPEIPVHISTQSNNTNYGTFRFWYDLGVKRVVTARELSLKEIREIREHIPEDMEIESFVHGAMCISYSGRCLLSSYLAGRDANRGACTHPCRWRYHIVEETRPGEYMPVYENERGTYIFNSKDLCMIDHLPDLAQAGIDSLKVEGRMKTALYVATVARAYRLAIDTLAEDPERYAAQRETYKRMVSDGTYRNFTTGFYYGKPDQDSQIYDSNTYIKNAVFLGAVEAVDGRGRIIIHQKNKFCRGDRVTVMKPDGRDLVFEVLRMENDEDAEVPSAPHPGQEIRLTLQRAAKGSCRSIDAEIGENISSKAGPEELPEVGDILKMESAEETL